MAEPGVHGEFFRNPVLQGFRSEQEGRPIYDDEDWVRIKIAGQDKDVVERKATNIDKERFAEAWAKYERGLEQAKSGTPLEMWPRMTPGMVATLKAINIMSVEDMATLSDAGVQRVGIDGYKLRGEAQAFLNSAAQVSAVMEVDRLQARCDAQAIEIEELKKLVEQMLATQQRGAAAPAATKPARKRKAVELAPE